MTTLTTVAPEIARDRYGRPLVVPPGGGKAVAYTRCTTYIDVLEDKFALTKWMMRMTALGLSTRPDLMLAVAAHREDKKALDRICEDAKEAAAASAAATTGTALHALTELVDSGRDLPVLPETAVADLMAYKTATRDLKAVHIEQFCVLDDLKVGGTPDRVVEVAGQRYIADIKTGSIEYGILKIAMQLAVYARAATYDIGTGTRGDHAASLERGLIIHLPAGQAMCSLHWVDLEVGWQAVQVAGAVREHRKTKFGDITAPYSAADGVAQRTTLADQIAACTTADEVRALWAANASRWTDALTEQAKAHITKLPAA